MDIDIKHLYLYLWHRESSELIIQVAPLRNSGLVPSTAASRYLVTPHSFIRSSIC